MSLDELLVSGDELDAELLTTALKPFVRVERETLRVRPQAAWRTLGAKGKVVAFLLTKKGMRSLGLISEEACLPAQIIDETGIPKGSVHPTLKTLYEDRPQIVERDSQSRYHVPNWAVHDAVALLGKGARENGG